MLILPQIPKPKREDIKYPPAPQVPTKPKQMVSDERLRRFRLMWGIINYDGVWLTLITYVICVVLAVISYHIQTPPDKTIEDWALLIAGSLMLGGVIFMPVGIILSMIKSLIFNGWERVLRRNYAEELKYNIAEREYQRALSKYDDRVLEHKKLCDNLYKEAEKSYEDKLKWVASAIGYDAEKLKESYENSPSGRLMYNTFDVYRGYVQSLTEYYKQAELRNQEYFWRGLDGYKFEDEIASFFKKKGYGVEQTKYSNDGGVDCILKKGGVETYVQCKHYINKVGIKEVREFYGVLCDKGVAGIYATINGVNQEAEAFCKRNKIKVMTVKDYKSDGDALRGLIEYSEDELKKDYLNGRIVYYESFDIWISGNHYLTIEDAEDGAKGCLLQFDWCAIVRQWNSRGKGWMYGVLFDISKESLDEKLQRFSIPVVKVICIKKHSSSDNRVM